MITAVNNMSDRNKRLLGAAFTSKDYAVSWGIVYMLLNGPANAGSRERFNMYVEAAKNGFFEDRAEFTRIFPDKAGKSVIYEWNAYIARKSLEYFEKLIIPDDMTLEEWQKEWQKEILRLKS